MVFKLAPLPYATTALEPHISAKTLEFHHGKHHAAYVKKLNELIEGTKYAAMSLEQIVKATAAAGASTGDEKSAAKIFDNAAQAWNHDFYWQSMSAKGGGKPQGALAEAIVRDFGSFDDFAAKFKAAATGQFGSGWAWLVQAHGKLVIAKTANADLPLAHGQQALLAMDVWEHAYYLDYQNRRPDYVAAFLGKLANWQFAAANLQAAA